MALLVIAAVTLTGPGFAGDVTAPGSSSSRSWDAASRRLEGEAAAYFAEQADIARGRAADSARLQAAADSFAAMNVREVGP